MIITNDILQSLSEKYNLDFNKFKFVKKKFFFFNVKYFIYYSSEEYFFQITKYNKDIGKYFPYFAKMSNLQNIEIWIRSICLTQNKKQKIVSDLKEGLNKRNEFKSKYKV